MSCKCRQMPYERLSQSSPDPAPWGISIMSSVKASLLSNIMTLHQLYEINELVMSTSLRFARFVMQNRRQSHTHLTARLVMNTTLGVFLLKRSIVSCSSAVSLVFACAMPMGHSSSKMPAKATTTAGAARLPSTCWIILEAGDTSRPLTVCAEIQTFAGHRKGLLCNLHKCS